MAISPPGRAWQSGVRTWVDTAYLRHNAMEKSASGEGYRAYRDMGNAKAMALICQKNCPGKLFNVSDKPVLEPYAASDRSRW